MVDALTRPQPATPAAAPVRPGGAHVGRTPPPIPAGTVPGGPPAPVAHRVVRRAPGLVGSAAALVGFCASLTPSLLPRHWALQGLLSGLLMAMAYGAGAAVGGAARRLWPRPPSPGTRCWAVLGGAAAVAAVVFLALADGWQRELRTLTGMAPSWRPVPLVLLAAAVLVALVLAARAVRLATRRLRRLLHRWLPRPVAAATAVAMLAGAGVVSGDLSVTGLVTAQERLARAAAAEVDPAGAPGSPYVSGGPGSLVPWETLGDQGRAFVTGAVPVPELAVDGGRGGSAPVRPPVRAYVGHDSAPGAAARARLAVRELERAGGFDRSVVGAVVTTGTGWVNPAVAESLERLYHGDTALVATQYSFQPSWVAYLADRDAATAEAAALLTALRERIGRLPAAQRPRLVVYGESLGAYGVETAFGGVAELLAVADGALLAGAPWHSPVRRQLTAAREPDSPAWRPRVGDGVTVQFGQEAADLAVDARVVYLQNASDPVAWWTPELIHHRPDWLARPRGPDVSAAVRWLPGVTFWQVTVDLLTSTAAPDGHGHSYREQIAGGWAALLPPVR